MLGFQGKAQLEVIYGHLAGSHAFPASNQIFMKTAGIRRHLSGSPRLLEK